MENKLWMNYAEYKKLNECAKYLERKWWAEHLHGIHPGQYPELEEFQSRNKSRSISLKDSIKFSQGAGYTALLSGQKGSDILQDKTVFIPAGRAFTIILSEDWNKASKDWNSLCSSDESEV